MSGLKYLNPEGTRVGGYLVRWGNPTEKDLQGEYFTKRTDLGLNWYPQRPVLYHHGLDGTVKTAVIGVIDTLKSDDTGVWAEAQIDLHSQYAKHVASLIEKGIIGWSSGSLPHLVEVAHDGFIKRWPIVEGSLTPTPAEPRQTDVQVIKSAYKALGLDTSALKLDEGETAPEGQDSASGEDQRGAEQDTSGDGAGAPEPEVTPDTPEPVPTPPQSAEGDAPDATDEQPERTFSLMDQLQSILNAVLQVLGYTEVTDEQMSNLNTEVSKLLEGRVGTSLEEMAPANMKAAFSDEAFKRKVHDAIKAALAPPLNAQDIATGFRGLSNAGRGGISRVPGGVNQSPVSAQTPTQIQMRTKYERAGLTVQDLAYWYTVNRQLAKHEAARQFPREAYRELLVKADEAIKTGALDLRYEDDPQGMKATGTAQQISARANAVKANELNHTTNTGYGEEWIPDLWSTELWMDEREELVVAQRFQQIDMPSDPFNYPIEGVDPEMELVPETTNAAQLVYTDSATSSVQKIGTDSLQFTTDKFMLRIGISAEQEEDGIISTLSEARRKTLRVFDETRDSIILNADSATTGNVNLYDATPTATKPYMTSAGAGLIKTAFDNGKVFDAGGAPTLALMRKLRFEGLDRQYRKQMSNLVYIIDSETEGALIGIPEFLTLDKLGQNATVITGMIGALDNIPVVVSGELEPAATNGKVSNTGANNTKGRALLVYRPWHKIGFRRNVRITSEFIATFDAHMLVLSARMGQKQRSGNYVAMLRNIAV